MRYLIIWADLITAIASSDFIKFVAGAVIVSMLYLLLKRVSEGLTAGLVRKAELKHDLEEFKTSLTRELVTTADLKIFKLEQAQDLEQAMKDNRHSIRNDIQQLMSKMDEHNAISGQRMSTFETTLARIDEHVKLLQQDAGKTKP